MDFCMLVKRCSASLPGRKKRIKSQRGASVCCAGDDDQDQHPGGLPTPCTGEAMRKRSGQTCAGRKAVRAE